MSMMMTKPRCTRTVVFVPILRKIPAMGPDSHSHRIKPPSPPYQPQLRFLCARRPGSSYARSTVTICSIRRASSALRCFSQPSPFSGICWLRV